MTISQTQLDQALSEPEIKKFWLGYFQENFRQEIQQQIIELFDFLKAKKGLTRADLARKIGRRPEQVTRWLSSPTNLESDTISDIALGMGMIPKLTFESVNRGG
jgi:DNA-binding phage protein